MEDMANLLVDTSDRPFATVDELPGIEFKPMHMLEHPPVWSSVIRLRAGQRLFSRRHTALCEFLIIEGVGKYVDGPTFGKGDYIREVAGDYAPIEAHVDLLMFLTHHGECSFVVDDFGAPVFTASGESLRELT